MPEPSADEIYATWGEGPSVVPIVRTRRGAVDRQTLAASIGELASLVFDNQLAGTPHSSDDLRDSIALDLLVDLQRRDDQAFADGRGRTKQRKIYRFFGHPLPGTPPPPASDLWETLVKTALAGDDELMKDPRTFRGSDDGRSPDYVPRFAHGILYQAARAALHRPSEAVHSVHNGLAQLLEPGLVPGEADVHRRCQAARDYVRRHQLLPPRDRPQWIALNSPAIDTLNVGLLQDISSREVQRARAQLNYLLRDLPEDGYQRAAEALDRGRIDRAASELPWSALPYWRLDSRHIRR